MPMDQLVWETREEALYYEDLGLSVFDLPYGSKIPDRPWREFSQSRAPPDRLSEMFAVRRNIAIATGRVSNLLFLDLDGPQAVAEASRRGYLDITPIISETRRGLQLGFRPPEVPVKNAVKLEGLWDVRSDGGYVVAPSSMHPSGVRYKRLGNWLDDNVPRFPEELIPKEAPPKPRELVRNHAPDYARTLAWASDILFREYFSFEHAGGDLGLFKAACFLIQRARLHMEDARELLRQWNHSPANVDVPWPDSRITYKLNEALRLRK